jgi:hypothetical protein
MTTSEPQDDLQDLIDDPGEESSPFAKARLYSQWQAEILEQSQVLKTEIKHADAENQTADEFRCEMHEIMSDIAQSLKKARLAIRDSQVVLKATSMIARGISEPARSAPERQDSEVRDNR